MLEHNKKYLFRFGDKKIVINKHYNDPEWYVYAKALVFALYHKQYRSMQVEAKVDERFNPDLSAMDYTGAIVFWGEVGNVSMAKVEKLFKKFRHAHYVFVKEERDLDIFKKHLEKATKDLRRLPSVEIIAYPPHFHEWNVSEEGDVFIRKEDVDVIVWSVPGQHNN